jgi:hypothetical protein
LGAEVSQKSANKFILSGLDRLPESIRLSIAEGNKPWIVSFVSPAPEKSTFLGRNHPFVAALAQFLLEEALIMGGSSHAPRCGVIRTTAVNRRTFLMLLRIRFSITEPDRTPMIAEEATVFGFAGTPPQSIEQINENSILALISSASPHSNISTGETKGVLAEFLESWEAIKPQLKPILDSRAQKLSDSHRRVRAAAHLRRRGLSVSCYFPPDLLGILALLPIPKGVTV